MRIMHESVLHPASWFATLTYEKTPEYGSLDPHDFRKFIRRLRKKVGYGRMRYYACGEYGERSDRPHYHAVLFGPLFVDRQQTERRNGTAIYDSQLLRQAWGHGRTEISSLSYAAAAYVAGYVRKKVRVRDSPEHYSRVDPRTGEIVQLHQEFARMSTRPAIGRSWIEKYWRDVYPRDFVVVDGVERKPPRYYDKWMDTNQPAVMADVREQRYKDMQEVSTYTLDAREKTHTAKLRLFSGRHAI